MRITYIGSFKNLWDEEGNARALESLGHEVTRISEIDPDFYEKIEESIASKPDAIFFAKLKLPYGRDQLFDQMRKNKIPTICWNFDLYIGLDRESFLRTDPIFKADYVFTPDGGHEKQFRDRNINHYCVRQGIAKEYCYMGEFQPKHNRDVVFVGCENRQWKQRTEMCNALMDYPTFYWHGKINTLDVRGHKLNSLYASAKTVVGDSVYSPYYWSNRLYETLGRGAFTFFMEIEGLEDEYEPYKHYIPFKMGDWKELKKKINHYLDRPDERDNIRKAALEHTLNNHTLEHRVKQILDICEFAK